MFGDLIASFKKKVEKSTTITFEGTFKSLVNLIVFFCKVFLNCLQGKSNISLRAVCLCYETSFCSSVTAVEGFPQVNFHVVVQEKSKTTRKLRSSPFRF